MVAIIFSYHFYNIKYKDIVFIVIYFTFFLYTFFVVFLLFLFLFFSLYLFFIYSYCHDTICCVVHFQLV